MSKIGNKLKSFSRIFRNYTPRKLAITLLAVAALLVPAFIYAATPGQTPTWTWNQPAPYVYFNSITDNPYWGNEQDFVRIIDANGNQVNNVSVQDGQTYTVQMLVHNDSSLGLKPDATDVRGGLGYDVNNDGTSTTITGVVRASNVGAMTQADGKVLSVGGNGQWTDTVIFSSTSKFKLSYVPGTANYTTQFSGANYNDGGKTFQLPDSAINTGTSLGFNSMDGNIPGCWPHHGILTAKFTVKGDTPTPPVVYHPSYDVAKSVDKTTAKPGETLSYTITVKNTGDQALTNVKVNDTLPKYLTAVDGTFSANPNTGVSGSLPGTVNIANLPVGATTTLTVKAKIANENALECGNNSITNKVTSSTDQTNKEDNNNNNSANTDVNRDCTPPKPNKPSMNLVKTVDKTSGVNGDTLTYVLLLTNTGNTELKDVVIKDSLPAGVKLVGKIDAAGKGVTGASDLDKLFTTGAKFAKIDVGGYVRITLQVKVNDDFVKLPNGVNCGNASKDLINTSSSTATDDKGNKVNETKTDDNTVSTVIVKNEGPCSPDVPVVPTNPETPTTPTNPATPYNPGTIAATGPVETIAALLAVGALTFGTVAYVNSRRAVKANLKK